MKSDGTVWTWGYNRYGELGNATTNQATTPLQVSGLSGITAIEAGEAFAIALKNDGSVWTWGLNNEDQLGRSTSETCTTSDGSFSCGTTAGQVTDISDVKTIAIGGHHVITLKSNDSVWAWGGNWAGELGNGKTTNSSTPVQVIGLSSVAAIAGGYLHSIALKNDGTVWTWGYNEYGVLGNGTTTDSSTAVQVSGLSLNPTYSLSVSKSGTGSGTVTSSDSNINCGSTCSYSNYSSGTSVTLTATASSGSTFSSWSGCDSTNGTICTVSMTSNKSVTATFTAQSCSYSLSSTSASASSSATTGSVTVTASSSSCSWTATSGASWISITSGGSGTVSYSVSANTSSSSRTGTITVAGQTFTITQASGSGAPTFSLTVTAPTGGTITSSDSKINCGTDCDETYTSPQILALTATPDSGYTFTSWGGDASSCGTTAVCPIPIDGNKSVTATFTSGTSSACYATYTNGVLTVPDFQNMLGLHWTLLMPYVGTTEGFYYQFSLGGATKVTSATCSSPATYSNGVLTVPNYKNANGKIFTLSLTYVVGSANPYRYNLTGATEQ